MELSPHAREILERTHHSYADIYIFNDIILCTQIYYTTSFR